MENINIDKIIELLKSRINSIVDSSFVETINQFKTKNDLCNWKNEIIKLIFKEIDKAESDLKNFIKDLNQKGNIKSEVQKGKELNQNSSKFYQSNNPNIDEKEKLHGNINQDKKLDFFTFKDIQDENKEITRTFQKEALDYIDEDEEIENESIAKFLIKVANVSRKAYNNSNELFINIFKEFSKLTKEKKGISTLKNDEQLRKEFSSWVKEYEKKQVGKEIYEYLFNSFIVKGKYDKKDYISTLLSQLTKLYFHCELSFPIVDIDFNLNSEIIFNYEKMFDFINTGNNRKVNFLFLPSLFSKGNYLENGKYWVFTYKKNTFRFGKLKFEDLVNKQEKYN